MTDLASVMADANGKFEIGGLARGSYWLKLNTETGSTTAKLVVE